MHRTHASRGQAIALALLLSGLAWPAFGQTVEWQAPGVLGQGQEARLDLVFSDTQPSRDVRLPQVPGLTILGAPSTQQQHSFINFESTSTFTLSYPVRASQKGDLVIPAFDVDTREGTLRVPSLRISVGEARVPGGRGGSSLLKDVLEAYLRTSDPRPYAGEVFDVDLLVALERGRRGEVAREPVWEHPGLVAEDFGPGERVRVGGGRSGVRFQTRAMVPAPGETQLPPAAQEMQIETGRDVRSFLFPRQQVQNVVVLSDPVDVDVRPLPPAPPGFAGAVGSFELESKLVPEQVAAGEPVTWTLSLKGTGNWPVGVELPGRAIPTDIRTIAPKSQRTFAPGEVFTGELSEDLVMIPTQSGEVELEPVEFVYFDPVKERYETLRVQPPALTVSPPLAAAPRSPTPAQPLAQAPPRPKASGAAPKLRALEPELPRDPITGSEIAPAPQTLSRVLAGAAVPVLLLAFYWLARALAHSRATDPNRPQREAFAALREAIAEIERARASGDRERLAASLLAWQHAAARVLELDVAAPTSVALDRALQAEGTSAAQRDRWAEAWSESDAAVYAEAGELPATWADRASALASEVRLPRWNPLRTLLPSNLFPRAVAIGILGLLATLPWTASAQGPVEAYLRGDFEVATEGFAAQVAQAPTDWVARSNLSLSLSQQGAAGPAFAQASAALLMAPRDENVRWNWQIFAERTSGLDAALRPLAPEGPFASLVASASPARWQWLAIVGSLVACLGAGALVHRRYSPGSGAGLRRVGMGLLGAGVLLGGSAAFALGHYGILADPQVVMLSEETLLRSVPTDAETPQESRVLPAGTVARQAGRFLGWVRVALPSGETGWLRTRQIVPLYERPRAADPVDAEPAAGTGGFQTAMRSTPQ